MNVPNNVKIFCFSHFSDVLTLGSFQAFMPYSFEFSLAHGGDKLLSVNGVKSNARQDFFDAVQKTADTCEELVVTYIAAIKGKEHEENTAFLFYSACAKKNEGGWLFKMCDFEEFRNELWEEEGWLEESEFVQKAIEDGGVDFLIDLQNVLPLSVGSFVLVRMEAEKKEKMRVDQRIALCREKFDPKNADDVHELFATVFFLLGEQEKRHKKNENIMLYLHEKTHRLEYEIDEEGPSDLVVGTLN
jgi:hypothetical protein